MSTSKIGRGNENQNSVGSINLGMTFRLLIGIWFLREFKNQNSILRNNQMTHLNFIILILSFIKYLKDKQNQTEHCTQSILLLLLLTDVVAEHPLVVVTIIATCHCYYWLLLSLLMPIVCAVASLLPVLAADDDVIEYCFCCCYCYFY